MACCLWRCAVMRRLPATLYVDQLNMKLPPWQACVHAAERNKSLIKLLLGAVLLAWLLTSELLAYPLAVELGQAARRYRAPRQYPGGRKLWASV